MTYDNEHALSYVQRGYIGGFDELACVVQTEADCNRPFVHLPAALNSQSEYQACTFFSTQ